MEGFKSTSDTEDLLTMEQHANTPPDINESAAMVVKRAFNNRLSLVCDYYQFVRILLETFTGHDKDKYMYIDLTIKEVEALHELMMPSEGFFGSEAHTVNCGEHVLSARRPTLVP